MVIALAFVKNIHDSLRVDDLRDLITISIIMKSVFVRKLLSTAINERREREGFLTGKTDIGITIKGGQVL